MPFSFLSIVLKPTPAELGMAFGGMQAEMRQQRLGNSPPAYADGTPVTLEGCLCKIDDGQWLPILCYFHDMLATFHWLHDMDQASRTTWIGGYVMPSFRGQQNTYLKAAAWPRIVDAVAILGYDHVHCGILPGNEPAQRWARDVQGYTYVGRWANWLHVQAIPHACDIYTLHADDYHRCELDADARALAVLAT